MSKRILILGILLLPTGAGCTIAPKSFRRIDDKAPLVRARAAGMGASAPPGAATPALVGKLEDTDPAVRLAAHEELKRSTGQDFGFVPWADPAERSTAVSRWKAWLGQRPRPVAEAMGRARKRFPRGNRADMPTQVAH